MAAQVPTTATHTQRASGQWWVTKGDGSNFPTRRPRRPIGQTSLWILGKVMTGQAGGGRRAPSASTLRVAGQMPLSCRCSFLMQAVQPTCIRPGCLVWRPSFMTCGATQRIPAQPVPKVEHGI